MNEAWRNFLYYPLGILPSLFFSLRFLLQWIKSEKQKRSLVDSLFWRLSLTGNILLFTHYFIQLQYPFALIQAGNAFIAWRNLNLMKHPYSTRYALGVLAALLLTTTCLFIGQGIYWAGAVEWMRIPNEWENFSDSQSAWHALGIGGQLIFTSRFWIQWFHAEKKQVSELGKSFWLASLIGSLLSLAYFAHIRDSVSLLNALFGLIPCLRNLQLLAKQRRNALASKAQ